jgi:hypothetical protein
VRSLWLFWVALFSGFVGTDDENRSPRDARHAPNVLNAWQGLPTQPTNGTCDQTLESSPNQGQ